MSQEASVYLRELDDRPVKSMNAVEALRAFEEPLPEIGSGASRALSKLITEGFKASVTTAGPRSFHFVIGGTTPLPWVQTGWLRHWIRWNNLGWLRF